jgi:hypothetical protein
LKKSRGGEEDCASATRGNEGGQKKRGMVAVMKAIHKTPPSVSVEKSVTPAIAEADEAVPEAENSEGPLGTTMSEIARIIADVVFEREMAEVSTDRVLPLK